MTERDDHEISDAEVEVIELTRRLARALTAQVLARGVARPDALIGLAYALHDGATDMTGSRTEAVEWIRTAADLMERQLMEPADGKPKTH